MANILQVGNPSVSTDRNTLETQRTEDYNKNPNIHNPVDPSRVVRADGKEDGKTNDTAEKGYGIIDYESNYGAFIKRLGEGNGVPGLLEQFLSQRTAGFLFGDMAGVGDLIEKLITSVRVDSQEELFAFLKGQQEAQAKFSGPFFDNLRRVLQQNPSDGLKDAILSFLKAYNDYSSGSHFLHQMRSISEDMKQLFLRGGREELQQMLEEMDWDAGNGDTAANTVLLNGRLIPFLSNYISRTHDYGAVRDAVMLFVFHAVRYENGSQDRLEQLFGRMAASREFAQLDPDGGKMELSSMLSVLGRTGEDGYADALSALLLRGANGQAGLENVQQFYDALNGLLLNESVYMPLLHALIPFQYHGKNVTSEIWTDPDSSRGNDGEGRKVKMFIKFDIQNLGKFDMILACQDRNVDIQLNVPMNIMDRYDAVQERVCDIFRKNGLGIQRFYLAERSRDVNVSEVFPEIREKERTVNVRI